MKRIISILLVLLMTVAFCSCGKTENPKDPVNPGPVVNPDPVVDPKPEIKAVKFDLERKSVDGKEGPAEKGILHGLNADGKELFAIETDEYYITELDKLQAVGLISDNYYLICNTEIWCIGTVGDNCGKILWKNTEFGGASAFFEHDENGNFFAAGYYEPAYFAVDKDGKTIVRCADSLASYPEGVEAYEFYFPNNMKYINNLVYIKYDSSDATIAVDPLTGKAVSVTYPPVDASTTVGTWKAVLCEIDGMEWTPSGKVSLTITINTDMTMDFVYTAQSKSNNKTFKAIPTSVKNSPMYTGIESFSGKWFLDAVKDKKNEITFAQTGTDTAEAFWYQGDFNTDEYPAVLWIKLERK